MVKRKLFLILLAAFGAVGCQHKDLSAEDPCAVPGDAFVRVVVNWDDPADARPMRMNIFSQTQGVINYGQDAIPAAGKKTIRLFAGASYLPFCYDYYANVGFRNTTNLESFEAYCPEVYRQTYNELATPVEGEKTIVDPRGDFFVHSWQETYDVELIGGEYPDIDFYPKNKLRPFTYRVENIEGEKNIEEARGACSGMSAFYHFLTDTIRFERATVLFEHTRVGTDQDGKGYIEGTFYTFGPVFPYMNRFTIEILSQSEIYYTAYWDVSGQISESMANRPAKLARDKYDILIKNTGAIPPIPDPEGGGDDEGGFDVGVGDWNNVDIIL